MILNNNKGITLIVLTITIIVLLIIAGITIYTGSNLIQEAKIEDVKTNMLLVQAEMKNFVEQAKFEKKTIENILADGITLDEVTLRLGEGETIEGETYYKITSSMNDLHLGKLNPDNYLVDIKIDDADAIVYFKPGIADGEGNVYHLLSQMP